MQAVRLRRRVMFGFLTAVAVSAAVAGWWMLGTEPPAAQPARPPARVVLTPAETTRLVRELRAIGTVEATSSVMIAAEVTGRVAELPFEDGQMVEEGRPLVVLDPGPVEAELRAAEAQAAEIAQQVERSGQLAARGFSPRGDLEDARRQLDGARARAAAARARLEQSRIVAPFPGRIGLREVSVGALVQPGTPLVPLDAVDPIDLRFALPEQEAARLAPGAAVRATSAALPGRLFEGEVRVLATRVDPATRTMTIEARLPNPDGVLKPGMLLQVAAAAEVVEGAVTVPPRAVQLRGPDHFVFTVEEGRARRLPVTIGERTAERIEIREGLEPGMQVVVEGLQGLEDGAQVAPAGPQRQAEAAR
jgi:membrane fusion protein (multidrug efflux system)